MELPIGNASSGGQDVNGGLSLPRLGICACLAALALWPMLLVSAPMVYFDTYAYASAGRRALEMLWPAPSSGDTGAAAAAAATGGSGLRSAAWSVTLAGLGGLTWGAVVLCWAQTVLTLACLAPLVPPGVSASRGALAAGALLLTGLPWYASYGMPDLLGAAILAYYAVLVAPGVRLGLGWRWLLGLGAAFAIMGHYGHLPLSGALAGLVLLVGFRQGRLGGALALAAFGPLALALAVNATVSVALERSATDSASAAPSAVSVAPRRLPIVLARALEDGPARRHLEAACATDSYRSCAFLPDPLPDTVGGFLWSDETGIGGLTSDQRRILESEELRIVRDAARAYPLEQAAALARNALRQFVRVGISEHLPRPEDIGARPSHADHEAHPVLPRADRLIPLTVWAGCVALALLAWRRGMPGDLRGPLTILVAGLLVNAAIFGGLSYPVDRYQGRIAWLLPALALLVWTRGRITPTEQGSKTGRPQMRTRRED